MSTASTIGISGDGSFTRTETRATAHGLPRPASGWLPKQKRPAAMRVNKEARNLALRIRVEEQKRVEAGHPREYWPDMEDRPFMSDMDAFCIEYPRELYEYSIANRQWCRPWRIRHLAITSNCFDDVLNVPRDEDDPSNRPTPRSGWDALKRCLKFFSGLERISLVFGPTYTSTGREVQIYEDFSEIHSLAWSSDIPHVRLEEWTAGSTEDTQAKVDGLLDRARADVAFILQKCARRREEIKRFEEEADDKVWGMIGNPWGYEAAELITRDHVTVQAMRMVKLGEFRGRLDRRH